MENLDFCTLCGHNQIQSLESSLNIVQCQKCGFVFDNPRPTQDEISNYYSQPGKYVNWLADEKEREDLWERRLQKMSPLIRGGVLLDVGAGIGQFLNVAKERFSEVAGTEVSSEAVKLARERYGLDITLGTLETANFPANNFDVITFFHVLEHLPSPKQAVQTSSTLLKQGGYLVVAVPNDLESLKVKTKLLLQRLGLKKYSSSGKVVLPKVSLDGSIDEIHLSHFTPSTLSYLLESNGFKVVSNSLDPYYVASGKQLVRKKLYYTLMSVVNSLLGKNLYDTIWMVAKKN